jgi:hypothetical protein
LTECHGDVLNQGFTADRAARDLVGATFAVGCT